MNSGTKAAQTLRAPAPSVPGVNQKEAQRLLEVYGWTRTVGGKHVVKMVREGCRPITLPHHRGGE